MEQNFMEEILMLSCLVTSLRVKRPPEVAEAAVEGLAEVDRVGVLREAVAGEVVDRIVLVEVGPLPVMTPTVGTPMELLLAETLMIVTPHHPEILMTPTLVILTHGTPMLEIHMQEIRIPVTRTLEILMLETRTQGTHTQGILTQETPTLDCLHRRQIHTHDLRLSIMNEEHLRHLGHLEIRTTEQILVTVA
jgi:hypothetical protein